MVTPSMEARWGGYSRSACLGSSSTREPRCNATHGNCSSTSPVSSYAGVSHGIGEAPAPLPLAQTALTWVGHTPGMHPSVMSATVTSVPVGHGTPRVVGGNRGGTDSERRRISVDRRRHCRKWGWESQSQWREHLQLQPTCSAGLPVPHPTPLQGTSQWPPAAVAVTPASSDAVPTPPEKLAPATGAYYRLFIHRVLPQIPNLNGETVQDWVEHFEAVATLAGWNDHFAFSVSAQGNCQSILSVVYTGAKEQLPPPRDGIEETIHPRPVDRRGDPAFSQSSTGYKGVCR